MANLLTLGDYILRWKYHPRRMRSSRHHQSPPKKSVGIKVPGFPAHPVHPVNSRECIPDIDAFCTTLWVVNQLIWVESPNFHTFHFKMVCMSLEESRVDLKHQISAELVWATSELVRRRRRKRIRRKRRSFLAKQGKWGWSIHKKLLSLRDIDNPPTKVTLRTAPSIIHFPSWSELLKSWDFQGTQNIEILFKVTWN